MAETKIWQKMNKTLKDKHRRLSKCGTRQMIWWHPRSTFIRNRAMLGNLNEHIFCFHSSHAVCYICFSFPLSFQSCAVTIHSFFWCYVHSRWRNWKKRLVYFCVLYYSHKTAKCVFKYEIMQCAQYFFPHLNLTNFFSEMFCLKSVQINT